MVAAHSLPLFADPEITRYIRKAEEVGGKGEPVTVVPQPLRKGENKGSIDVLYPHVSTTISHEKNRTTTTVS